MMSFLPSIIFLALAAASPLLNTTAAAPGLHARQTGTRPSLCDKPCTPFLPSTCDTARPVAGACCTANVVQAQIRCLNCEVFTGFLAAPKAQADYDTFKGFCTANHFFAQGATIDGTFVDGDGAIRGPQASAISAAIAASRSAAGAAASGTGPAAAAESGKKNAAGRTGRKAEGWLAVGVLAVAGVVLGV